MDGSPVIRLAGVLEQWHFGAGSKVRGGLVLVPPPPRVDPCLVDINHHAAAKSAALGSISAALSPDST